VDQPVSDTRSGSTGGFAEAIAVFMWRVRRLCVRVLLAAGTRRSLPRDVLAPHGAAPVLFFAHYRTLLDGMVLWLALPRQTVFVVHPFITTARFWFRCLAWLGGVRTIAVSSDRPFAIRGALRAIKAGKPVCMFPMEVMGSQGPSPLYQGVSFLLLKTNARLAPLAASRREGVGVLDVPVARAAQEQAAQEQVAQEQVSQEQVAQEQVSQEQADGAWLSVPESTARRNLFRAGSVGESLASAPPSDAPGRHAVAHRMKLIASMLSFQAAGEETLWTVLRSAADRGAPRQYIFENHRGRVLSNGSFVHFAKEYSRLIEQVSDPGEIVGLIVPSSARGAAVYFGTVSIGRIAALLPHDLPARTVVGCAHEAGARTVIAFRSHVGAQLSYQTMGALEDAGIRVVYLDRPLPERRSAASFRALLADVPLASGLKRDARAPSTILFGTDAHGVWTAALHSDSSLLAAAGQLKLAGWVRPEDAILCALPIYDPMGLAAGVILPLISGARSILQDHPQTNPRLAEVAYNRNATLIFAGRADIREAARDGHSCDLHGVRSVVVSGVPADSWLQHRWLLKYGRPLLESYGLAEMGGFVAINGWMGFSLGGAGRLFPGIEARTVDPDPAGAGTIELHARSAFLGYIAGGKLEGREPGRWVATGTRACLNAEGHLVIVAGASPAERDPDADYLATPVLAANAHAAFDADLEDHLEVAPLDASLDVHLDAGLDAELDATPDAELSATLDAHLDARADGHELPPPFRFPSRADMAVVES
jgi:acyl-[acyl-carrier-protein]-phospholipid O-acyltransferase/long-chain-fatty-acid--[acyl-carrier-protein] ligase